MTSNLELDSLQFVHFDFFFFFFLKKFWLDIVGKIRCLSDLRSFLIDTNLDVMIGLFSGQTELLSLLVKVPTLE